MKFKIILQLFALIIALAGVLAFTQILILNQGVAVGFNVFIPEANQYIRISEILLGMFTIPILIFMIKDKFMLLEKK